MPFWYCVQICIPKLMNPFNILIIETWVWTLTICIPIDSTNLMENIKIISYKINAHLTNLFMS